MPETTGRIARGASDADRRQRSRESALPAPKGPDRFAGRVFLGALVVVLAAMCLVARSTPAQDPGRESREAAEAAVRRLAADAYRPSAPLRKKPNSELAAAAWIEAVLRPGPPGCAREAAYAADLHTVAQNTPTMRPILNGLTIADAASYATIALEECLYNPLRELLLDQASVP